MECQFLICHVVPVQKLESLVAIEAFETFNRRRPKEDPLGSLWLIFRGLNFSYNEDIGQIGHFLDRYDQGGGACCNTTPN